MVNISDIAAVTGIIITIVGAVSGVIVFYVNMKLKPILEQLTQLKQQNVELRETINFLVAGLLTNGQIPKQ